jgi:hypothetical protein
MENKIAFMLTFVMVFAALALVRAESDPMSSDEEAIRATVQGDFDGMMTPSTDALKGSFHPESRLIGLSDGELVIIPFNDWQASYDREFDEDWGNEAFRNKIVSVDIAGTAAVAKVDLQWPRVHYIDYLSLIKIGDEWKIVNKIWHQGPPVEPDPSAG